ncbi:MAG: sugar ABC transporter permease [Dactylosporangium sp.]|nr:sugar ABC transporter permease [Dactylosporangium sp.]NNJ63724.1 sugar ABC transporter permease [Dactylosporangium sp.]
MRTSSAIAPVGKRYRAPAPLGGRRRPVGARRGRVATAFLLPAAVILLAFVGWPIVSVIGLSFTDASGLGQSSWVGLANYREIFGDDDIRISVVNTVGYTVMFTPVVVLLALGLALLMNSPRLPLRSALRTALFIPVVVSLGVVAIAWSYLLDPNIGLLDHWFNRVGLDLGNVLENPTWAMPAVAAVAVWKNVGFYMVIFLAGLQGIPRHLYEAARVDGAARWQSFRHITLPLLSNTTAFVLIIAGIAALQAFDQIYVMTAGGPYRKTTTIVMQIYESGFTDLRLGFASALSLLLLAATLILSGLQLVFFTRREKELG